MYIYIFLYIYVYIYICVCNRIYQLRGGAEPVVLPYIRVYTYIYIYTYIYKKSRLRQPAWMTGAWAGKRGPSTYHLYPVHDFTYHIYIDSCMCT